MWLWMHESKRVLLAAKRGQHGCKISPGSPVCVMSCGLITRWNQGTKKERSLPCCLGYDRSHNSLFVTVIFSDSKRSYINELWKLMSFLKITLKFAISHNRLQEVSGNACYQGFIKPVNIAHSHGGYFGINVLHSGELVSLFFGWTTRYQAICILGVCLMTFPYDGEENDFSRCYTKQREKS